MVNFSLRLASNIIPDYEHYYLDYDGLKDLIRKIANAKHSYEARIGLSRMSRQNSEDSSSPYDENDEIVTSRSPLLQIHEPTTRKLLSGDILYQTFSLQDRNSLLYPLELEFEKKLRGDCEKVDTLYKRQLNEFRQHIDLLNSSGEDLLRRSGMRKKIEIDIEEYDDESDLPKPAVAVVNLLLAYSEVFHEMHVLQEFIMLNYTGFIKIVKKHDKLTGLKRGENFMEILREYSNGFGFSEAVTEKNELNDLITEVETQVAHLFFHDNKIVARNELMVKELPERQSGLLLNGFHMGVIVVLLIWVSWNFMTEDWAMLGSKSSVAISPSDVAELAGKGYNVKHRVRIPIEIIRVYKGMFQILLCFWGWVLVVYIWRKYKVNYTYIFEFDPRKVYPVDFLVIKASRISIVYLFNLLLYFKVSRGEIVFFQAEWANYVPLTMFILMFLVLIFPLSRTGDIYKNLGKVILTPFQPVTFFQVFLADVLTSIVRGLVDIVFSLCFYFTGEWRQYLTADANDADYFSCNDSNVLQRFLIPLVMAVPLFLRFLQSIRRYADSGLKHPHLSNALKYSLAYCLLLLASVYPWLLSSDFATGRFWWSLKVVWILSFSASAIFTFIWDVYLDWGLGNAKYGYLRKMRMYPKKSWYYAAMVGDFFLRFAWGLSLIPHLKDVLGLTDLRFTQALTFSLGVMEIFRRTYWTLLRVEWEHLSNSHGFRKVDFIPLYFEVPQISPRQRDLENKMTIWIEVLIFIGIVFLISLLSLIGPDIDA